MIVDRDTLDVAPLADRLLVNERGEIENEIERGDIAWSNELVAHVVEFKTNGPATSPRGLASAFAAEVREANSALAEAGACLLPTAMHPWMDPAREMRLWPHADRGIYEAFDRIFDCRGHGWANLQSMHVNLPFAGDDEFGRIHTAVRAVLPLLPALAASSPFVEGVHHGSLDQRLVAYESNARRVPSVSGAVVPEAIQTAADYELLLQSIYRDLEPFDPDFVVRHEWVNARGAIARFDRGAIEIRVLDVQECPRADLAIAHGVFELVRMLAAPACHETLADLGTAALAVCLRRTMAEGPFAPIDDRTYLEALELPMGLTAGEALEALLERSGALDADWGEEASCLQKLLRRGCLAATLVRELGRTPTRAELRRAYAKLAYCLANDVLYDAEA